MNSSNDPCCPWEDRCLTIAVVSYPYLPSFWKKDSPPRQMIVAYATGTLTFVGTASTSLRHQPSTRAPDGRDHHALSNKSSVRGEAKNHTALSRALRASMKTITTKLKSYKLDHKQVKSHGLASTFAHNRTPMHIGEEFVQGNCNIRTVLCLQETIH